MYQNSIEELINLSNTGKIEMPKLEYWLLKYSSLFQETHKNHTCSTKLLPCFCRSRYPDCFFVSVYSDLDEISDDYRRSLKLKKELELYHSIKDDVPKVSHWLREVEEDGLIEYTLHDHDKVSDRSIRIINGISNDKYENFVLGVEGKYFEDAFQFNKIFIQLFFNEKINLERYEKWAKDIGYEEYTDDESSPNSPDFEL